MTIWSSAPWFDGSDDNIITPSGHGVQKGLLIKPRLRFFFFAFVVLFFNYNYHVAAKFILQLNFKCLDYCLDKM